MTTIKNITKTVTVYRLSQEVYKELEKSLPGPRVNGETTPLQAGMMLGVEMVMRKLRDGVVVESTE